MRQEVFVNRTMDESLNAMKAEALQEFKDDLTPDPHGRLICCTYVCSKCTRYRKFAGETKIAAQHAANKKGWRIVKGRPICKKCPG